MTLITGNGVWDGIGTAMIGVLLVVIAVVLAIETKSLLLGEGAEPPRTGARSSRPSLAGRGVERVIHMQTLHLGPGGAAGRRQDRGAARGDAAPTIGPGASTPPRRGSARPCRSPG